MNQKLRYEDVFEMAFNRAMGREIKDNRWKQSQRPCETCAITDQATIELFRKHALDMFSIFVAQFKAEKKIELARKKIDFYIKDIATKISYDKILDDVETGILDFIDDVRNKKSYTVDKKKISLENAKPKDWVDVYDRFRWFNNTIKMIEDSIEVMK